MRSVRALVLLLFAVVFWCPHALAQKMAGDLGPIPVSADEGARGSAAAPVTLVVFTDLECPYCQKLHGTVEDLAQQYGQKLRIVYKHNPLPMHKQARAAALAAEAVRKLKGDRGYWRFVDEAFDKLRGGSVDEVLRSIGADNAAVQKEIAGGGPAKKVDADIQLAQKVGARGTPTSFVNGILVSGARKKDDFTTLIDGQLAEARAAAGRGIAPKQIYVELTKKNFAAPSAAAPTAPSKAGASSKDDSSTVWKVPVGRSPTLGPNTALVTMVVFSDFQCPFCSRALPTIESLRRTYADKLRLVFKHQPLPFHTRAEPAAELAMEAFARQGNKGFWNAHDKIFAQQRNLEDADLEQLAKDLGLNPKTAMDAVRNKKHAARILEDQDLAENVEAMGTPQFFINGRRVAGAQAESKFTAIIDEEIDKANTLIKTGVTAGALYDHIMKSAKEAPPPEKKTVPAPGKNSPSRGGATARVTVQMFTDFECPFCRRAQETMTQIEKEYGDKVRIVFRHRPLDFHTNAMTAHEAAVEAFRQGGNKAFWQLNELLYSHQDALTRADLVAYARQVNLDVPALERALDKGTHKKAIEADTEIAEKAGIKGTPSFVINGYFLSGAHPYRKFKRLIDRALAGR
jgi:protein-disulfide isomerase